MAENSPGTRKTDSTDTSIPEPELTDKPIPFIKQVEPNNNNNHEEPGGSDIGTAVVVSDITQLSEEQQQIPLTEPIDYTTEEHIPDNTGQTGQPIVPVVQRSTTSEQIRTDNQQIQTEEQKNVKDTVSLEKLLNLVDKRQTTVSLYSCTALVSEIQSCNKTKKLRSFLKNTVRLIDETQTLDFPDLGYHGFSSCKIIVLGGYPYENLTWLKSADIAEEITICLLSFYASWCKNRSQSNNYHDLLDVDPVLATKNEDLTTSFNPVLVEQCKQLHIEFRKKWERLKKDDNLREVIPNAVCLQSVCDIGRDTTGHDLLPVLNKYWKNTLHIVCYDSAIHQQIQHPYELIGEQLREELQNIDDESLVFLAAIDDENAANDQELPPAIDHQKADKLTEPLKRDIHHNHVYHIHVWASEKAVKKAKKKMEKCVRDGPFYSSKRIAHLLLLQMIKQKANSFWIKKSDFESYAALYKFESDEFDSILKFFTTFGSVLYIHDIERLREYVITDIVEFVKQIDILREANKKKELPNLSKEDLEVVEMFLTGLKICQ